MYVCTYMYPYMYIHVNGKMFFGKRDNVQKLFVDISVYLYM